LPASRPLAGVGALTVLCFVSTASLGQTTGAGAQAPTAQPPSAAPSTPSGPSMPTTPPPPGFPANYQSNIVFGGEFDTHLQAELTKPSGTGAKGTVFDDSELTLYGNYSTWLSLNSDIKLERNRNDNEEDFYPDRNSFLRSEGMTLRQLFATVRPFDQVSVYGGKIHPNFGSAYQAEPGNFYNFGSDYEQDERIGFGAQYALADLLGLTNVRLSVETFYLDTSFLSESLLSRPALDDPTADRLRRYTRNQFGPANTGSFDSYTVALRGGRAEQGLTWQISLTQEATDDPSGRTEYGQSIGATYDPTGDGLRLTGRLGLTPFLEYAHFTNFAGITGLERHYLIGGATFSYVRWQLILAGGLRKSLGASHDTDHQENVSLNYSVTDELTVGGGVNHVEIAGRGSWTIAPSLAYKIAF